MDENNANAALIERVERVVETLQDNSIKMGQLLAVHDEKLDKQDRIDAVLFAKVEQLQKTLDRETELIKAGCERDIRKVDDRLRIMEKKMWSIFGGTKYAQFAYDSFVQIAEGLNLFNKDSLREWLIVKPNAQQILDISEQIYESQQQYRTRNRWMSHKEVLEVNKY